MGIPFRNEDARGHDRTMALFRLERTDFNLFGEPSGLCILSVPREKAQLERLASGMTRERESGEALKTGIHKAGRRLRTTVFILVYLAQSQRGK
jgi:hypothetical protein